MSAQGFAQLVRAVVVVPDDRSWGSQYLGAGSIVRRLDISPPSNTGIEGEIAVEWLDAANRRCTGWLARNTPLVAPRRRELTREAFDPDEFTALDRLRSLFVNERQRTQTPRLRMGTWLVTFGPSSTTLLNGVRRELGNRPRPDDDAATVIRTVGRLLLNEEIEVSDEAQGASEANAEAGSTTTTPAGKSGKTRTKTSAKTAKGGKETKVTKTTTKKTTAKRATAKKATSGEGPARSMAVTVGNALTPLLSGNAKKLAQRLAANDVPGKRDLTTLRDEINAAAAKAREENKPAVASKLSSANRLVRRLVRSA